MIIRIEPELKEKFNRLARMEDKNTSQKISELVYAYTTKNDPVAIIDALWSRIPKKVKDKGFTEDDIGRAIRQVRNPR